MIWPQLSPCYSRNVLLLVRFSINCESWDFTFFIFVCSETSTVPGPWLPSNRYLLNAWILLFLLFSRDTGVVFFNSRALLYMIGTLYLVLCISISTSYCFLPYRALKTHQEHCPIIYSLFVSADLPARWLWHIYYEGTVVWFHTRRLLSLGPWQLPKTATLSKTSKCVTDKIKRKNKAKMAASPHDLHAF